MSLDYAMDYSNLTFRRQFLLTQDACDELAHWQHEMIGSYIVYVHPDVSLDIVRSEEKKTILAVIGYFIDPSHPDNSNIEILLKINGLFKSVDDIIDYICQLSGRFVLIINDENDVYVFHDPCGLRMVHYAKINDKIYAASQPLIFSLIWGLDAGSIMSEYNQSEYKYKNTEHWLPSGCSLYEKIYSLTPNHYLKFSTLRQIRYWPKNRLQTKTIAQVIDEVSILLTNLIAAAERRFPLSLPLTAGFDSRTLLSACKNIANDIYFYTLQYRNLTLDSADISIPNKLLYKLGYSHVIISCWQTPPSEFIKVYDNNTSMSHTNDLAKIAYGILKVYPSERVVLNGNSSEICRCFYYKTGKNESISNPNQIINLIKGWEKIPFICDRISNWFNQSRAIACDAGLNLLDLFYWEHRCGSWQSQAHLEWDIAQEVYTPYNHRGFISLMLGVPTEFRSAPNYTLYQNICANLWPDVLFEPINP